MPKTLRNARDQFDIPDHVAYLNVATMGPLPHAALIAGQEGLARKLHPWTITSDDFFADTRRLRPLLAALINADEKGIAIVPSASYGLATAARNLKTDGKRDIVILADQFPSNVYPWQVLAEARDLAIQTVKTQGNETLSDALLTAITSQTAIVAIPQVRWTDGIKIDLEAVSARCRSVGAALVLDLSQSCGAMTFDTARIQPDFIVCVGYKWLLGPYGMSFMYAAPQHRDGIPIEHNWITRKGAEDFSNLIEYQKHYAPGAERYDMGERSNFALLPALEASVSLLLDWGIPNIENNLAAQSAALSDQLQAIGLSVPAATERGPHYIGATLPASAPSDLVSRLKADDVHVSQRGNNLRITPHLFNTPTDFERLIDSLQRHLTP